MLRQALAMGMAACVLVYPGRGQTQIDIRTQTRNVDFSRATSTAPFVVADSLPAVCSTGQAIFRRDAPAGQNLYLCTANNTWTPTVASEPGGGGVSGTAPVPGSIGGVTITSTIDGAAIDVDPTFVATQAGDNQYIGHNDFSDAASLRLTRSAAEPDPAACDAADETGRVLFSTDRGNGLTLSICQETGAGAYGWVAAHHIVGGSAPARCVPGELFFNTSAAPGENWFGCTSPNVWTRMGGAAGVSPAGNVGDIQCNAGEALGACSVTGSGAAVRSVNPILTNATLQNPSLGAGYATIARTASAGVAAFTAVTLTESAAVATAAPASAAIVGIAVHTAAAGMKVEVATTGVVNCVAENATTAGRLAIPGIDMGGQCRDSGESSSTAIPVTTQILGRWLSSVAAGESGQIQLWGPGHHGASASTQVVKCAAGGSTSGSAQMVLGTATLPRLDPGAEVRVSLTWSHDGGTTIAPRLRIALGGSDILPVSNWTATDTARETHARIAITGPASQYNTFVSYRYPTAAQLTNNATSTAVDTGAPTILQIFGNMLSDGTAAGESVTLRQYCIAVLPAKL